MTTDEAKTILSAYRPDGSDAGDAAFAAALKMAEEDPSLGKWFARQQVFDLAFTAKFNEVQVPAGLRDAILSGGAVAGNATGNRRVAWWQQPRWMAMAAGFLVLLTAGVMFWPKSAAGDAPFIAFVANDARHSETHGGSGEPAGELQSRLSQPSTKLGDGLPVNFETLRTTGCRVVKFQGRDVLEVCFNRNGSWFHCYIVRQADFPNLAAVAKPAINDLDHMEMATWSDSAHVFLVVSDVGLDAMRRLL